jgi:hypothetical protein
MDGCLPRASESQVRRSMSVAIGSGSYVQLALVRKIKIGLSTLISPYKVIMIWLPYMSFYRQELICKALRLLISRRQPNKAWFTLQCLIRHWLAPASVHGWLAAVQLLPYWDSIQGGQGFGLSHFQSPAAAGAAIHNAQESLTWHCSLYFGSCLVKIQSFLIFSLKFPIRYKIA